MNNLFKKAGAVVINNPSNLFYFSGYANDDAVIVLLPEKKIYISDKRVTEEAEEQLRDFEVVDCGKQSYLEAAASIIIKQAPEYLGYEDQTILYKDYLELCKIPCKCIGVSEEINLLRAVKNPYELNKIKKAQSVTDAIFGIILSDIREGMAEKELCQIINGQIYSRGCTLAFDTIVAFGENTGKPHAHPSDRKLKKGDCVTVDFGAKYQGYCSDMTRSFAFGKPSHDYQKIYNIVLEAQLAAIHSLKAGITGKEGDAYARDVFRKYGLEKYFTHSLGHSLGVDIHENPRLSYKWDKPIPQGAVMSIEPGLYFPKEFGARIEDIAYFENNGIDNLTNSPKKLIIV
ncbi:MAG: aminopeptidase P family protein [Clostridia bacterium]|nr:aminopeptidase P family protein [Clostridia bacterium]